MEKAKSLNIHSSVVTTPVVENAPALIWRRQKYTWTARWHARTDIIQRGYRPKSVRLWSGKEHPAPADIKFISDKCQRLQKEMLDWSKNPNQKIASPRSNGHGYVYFIDDGTAIKIGFSVEIKQRFRNMQSANRAPLKLLALMPATADKEKPLHTKFHHARERGEWFSPVRELVAYVNEISSMQSEETANLIDQIMRVYGSSL